MSLFSSVQLLSRVWLFVTQWIAARQASLSITNSQGSLKLTSIQSVMPSSHLILCHPLLLLPSMFPNVRVFFNQSPHHIRWPGASASASVLPMHIQDWFPLGWTGWISFQSKGLSRVFLSTTAQKHQFFGTQLSLGLTLTSRHGYWKNHSFNYTNFFWHILQFNKYWLRTEFLW